MLSIFEALANSADPKKFWLVFNLPDEQDERSLDILDGLARGELRGVQGISSSRQIVTQWLQIARNAVLVMDPQECIRLNHLTQVRYDDADFLCRDNMKVMRRIFNQTGLQAYENIISTVLQHVARQWNDLDRIVHDWNDIRYPVARQWYKSIPHEVDSCDDLYRAIIAGIDNLEDTYRLNYAKESGLIDRITPEAVRAAVVSAGKMYETESEWLVHSDVFKIPANSTLLVSREDGIRDKAIEWDANDRPMDPFEYLYKGVLGMDHNIESFMLDKRYILRFINSQRFAKIRGEVEVKRNKKRMNESVYHHRSYVTQDVFRDHWLATGESKNLFPIAPERAKVMLNDAYEHVYSAGSRELFRAEAVAIRKATETYAAASGDRKRKFRIMERDGLDCWLCGEPMPENDCTLEHLDPRARTGTNDPKNLVLCHQACNEKLGALPKEEKEAMKRAMLSEAYLGTFNVETDWGGREVQEVFTNPSRREIGQMLNASEFASLRASLYPDTGDVYVWEGSRVQHHDMHHALFQHANRRYVRLFFDRTGIAMHSLLDDGLDSEEVELVKNSQAIRRLFGPEPNIRVD